MRFTQGLCNTVVEFSLFNKAVSAQPLQHCIKQGSQSKVQTVSMQPLHIECKVLIPVRIRTLRVRICLSISPDIAVDMLHCPSIIGLQKIFIQNQSRLQALSTSDRPIYTTTKTAGNVTINCAHRKEYTYRSSQEVADPNFYCTANHSRTLHSELCTGHNCRFQHPYCETQNTIK